MEVGLSTLCKNARKLVIALRHMLRACEPRSMPMRKRLRFGDGVLNRMVRICGIPSVSRPITPDTIRLRPR